MELITTLVDFVLHIDRHLSEIIKNYGVWTYAILFLIIFCETGLVVTPFLPGDSLLFAVGAFAAKGDLHVGWILGLLCVAGILGDTVNYWIGHLFGAKLVAKFPRIVKPEHLARTHAFYEKYGGKTIILARFVPIVRTFAPFVAGVGTMSYGRFFVYNVVGAIVWVVGFVLLGYFFGNLPVVKRNFTLVIMAIIVLSILPMVIEFLRARRKV